MEAVDELVGDDAEALHAPELIEPDPQRPPWFGGATGRDRRTSVRGGADLDDVPMIRHPHAQLRARTWSLRDQLTAYDASYLALAELLDARLLVTLDGGLARRAGASLGDERVRHLTA